MKNKLQYNQIYSAEVEIGKSSQKRFALISRRFEIANLKMFFAYWLALYPGIKKCLVCRKGNKNTRGLKIHFTKAHLKLPIDN